MTDRLESYLKSCGSAQSCKEFIGDKEVLKEEITSSADFEKDLKLHSALSNRTRLLIYRLIQRETMCNCTLAKLLGLSEGSITHHIKKLEEAELIIGRNKGHFVNYYTFENLLKDR